MAKETTVTESAAAGESAPVAEINKNAPLAPLTDSEKLKKLRVIIGSDRKFYEANAETNQSAFEVASETLAKAMDATENFFGLPVLTGEGLDTATRICVSFLGVRIKKEDSPTGVAVNGIKAITAFKLPTVQEFLDSEAANDFVAKLVEREAADVIFGRLRDPEATLNQLTEAMTGLPATVEEIISTQRESTGIDSETFDIMWSPFRQGWLTDKNPGLASALPQKPDVLKSLRSSSYALANPVTRPIEEKGLFVKIAQAMIKLAPAYKDKDGKPTPLDASSIQEWIEKRDSVQLSYKAAVIPDADSLGDFEF